jgi:4-amino-4-deoxy-L-arabinose transferase-like glycosyltransferase
VLLAAGAVFTANIHRVSLPSFDDCFYARKGVEMLERGGLSFVVTWNGEPSHQNPPLPFWVLAASFRFFGENDLAARLPSVLMALGIVVLTYRIGIALLDRDAALVGVGLLVLCPTFVQNARRCMLEVPNAFWTTLALWVVLESRRRPRAGLLLALPLAGALGTKSLLGLLPLLVAGCWAVHPDGRSVATNRWLCAGAALGALAAAAWPVQQGLTEGWHVARNHFLGEIAGRALQPISLWDAVSDYPRIVLRYFQPVVLPGLLGAALAFRGRRAEGSGGRIFLAIWALLPIVLFGFVSARSMRYVFPILVPLSLLAADLLVTRRRRTAVTLAARVVPVLLVAIAAVYWIRPSALTRDQNAPFKRTAADVRRLIPEGSAVPRWGPFAWGFANPFVYYGRRHLAASGGESLEEVLEAARELPTPAFVTPRERLRAIGEAGVAVEVFAELGDWVLVIPSRPAPS